MKLPIYQVDAFTDRIFGGNPACVVPLDHWLPDTILLNIAKENAVAETAYFIETNGQLHIRWFTPEIEMDLCGHATLATAHVLKNHLNYFKDEILFQSQSGPLKVFIYNDLLTLDFPSRKPIKADLPLAIRDSLNIQPVEVLKSRDYLLIYKSEDQIRKLAPDRQILDQINLDPGGIIVTAKGDSTDFVSRFFTSQASILEDPVTGSAHCSLIPFWSERLDKNELTALQLSERKGELQCYNKGERVWIAGKAITYCIGTIFVDQL